MTAPERIEVDGCTTCPFLDADEHVEMCSRAQRSVQIYREPPDWCPLRERDIVVTLRVK